MSFFFNGEQLWVGLGVVACDFDAARVSDDMPSVHRIGPDGSFHASPLEERVLDLSTLPSPYLTGLLDPFFDGVLLPIIQTNRGCPFRCTFCDEGKPYFSRVAKNRSDKSHREIHYIAEKMAASSAQGGRRLDLQIADSNFAMYKEDLEICATIAEVQEKYGYPQYIGVATGKNHAADAVT